MNKISFLSLFVLPVLLSCTGGSKDSGHGSDRIQGEWQQMDSGISRKLSFVNGRDFTFKVTVGNRMNSSTIFSGSYVTKVDSLKFKVNKVVRESADVIIPANDYQLYEKAIFSIRNDTLTLNYIGHRGDAPVKALAKFAKLL